MGTQFSTGIATGTDGGATASEAVADAGAGVDGDPDFALVFSSAEYDYRAVVDAVREETGGATLLGCSSAGEFTEDGVETGSVAVSLVASDEMQFFTGIASGLSEDIEGAVAEAAADLPRAVDGYPHMVGINLHDGLAGRGEEIAMVAYQEVPVPYSGGSAGDDLALEETYVFADDAVASDAVALGLIASKKPFSLSVNHGHEPVSEALEVTAAEGNVVTELDGEPAHEVWQRAVREPAREHYGIDVEAVTGDDDEHDLLLTRFEFGIETSDGDYKVRWPGLTPDTDGPLHFATTIPEGTELYVMHSPKDDQIESAREAGSRALERADQDDVAGAMVFDCVCRAAILEEEFDDAVDAMAGELGVPLVGFETYGEVCLREGEMRAYHNTTSSLVLLPE